MDILEFIDILNELIAVDTEEGLIKNTYEEGNTLTVNVYDGSRFNITVEKEISIEAKDCKSLNCK